VVVGEGCAGKIGSKEKDGTGPEDGEGIATAW